MKNLSVALSDLSANRASQSTPARWLGLILFLFTAVLYLPTVNNDFVWDAVGIYVANPQIQDLGNIFSGFQEIYKLQTTFEVEVLTSLHYYRPLTHAFHVIEYAMFGDNPVGYKVVSLLLHAVITLLIFRLFVSVQGDLLIAFLAALLWAVKPIHVETVAWTYSVSHLLVYLLSLVTLLLYRRGRLWMALFTFLLALFTQEKAVLLLPILFLNVWLLEDGRGLKRFKPLLPFVALTAGLLFIRTIIVGGLPLTAVEPLVFINTSLVIVKRCLSIFLWPDAPVTMYLAQRFTDFTFEVIISYLLALGLLMVTLLLWHKNRRGLFWFLWFFTWIATAFNIGQIGDYLMAEKGLYLSSAGLTLLLVIAMDRLFRGDRRLLLGIVLLGVGVQAMATWQRLPYWSNTTVYLQQLLQHEPGYFAAHYTLAEDLIRIKDYDQALIHLKRTLEITPRFYPAHNDIAHIYYLKEDLQQALLHWKSAIQYDATNPNPYYNIGMILEQTGQVAEAKYYYQRYLELEPNPAPQIVRRIEAMR